MRLTAPAPTALVTPSWLAGRLDDPSLVLLDATVGAAALRDGTSASHVGDGLWRRAHIPGSRHADLVRALSRPDAPFSYTAPDAADIADQFALLGVDDASQVVVYDDNDRSMWATRVWWLLRRIGFDNAAVLNGGWAGWQQAGLPVEQGDRAQPTPRGRLTVRAREVFRTKAEVLDIVAGRREADLICALDPPLFTGQDHGGYERGGHIPGASNLPARSLLDGERFLDPDALRDRLSALRTPGPIVVYCGGGISATVVAFALVAAGGNRTDVTVYDGSLEEWAADQSLPLISGP